MERGNSAVRDSMNTAMLHPLHESHKQLQTPYTTVVNYGKNKKKKGEILRLRSTPSGNAVQEKKKKKEQKYLIWLR